MKDYIYNLRNGGESSDHFYWELDVFTENFLQSEHVVSLQSLVESYKQFIVRRNIEKLRTNDEYTAELLQLGIFWISYNSYINKNHSIIYSILDVLYRIRTKFSRYKNKVDRFRGYLIAKINRPDNNIYFPGKTLTSSFLSLLMKWMKATGDFREEAKRLQNWHKCLQSLSVQERKVAFISILAMAYYFKNESLQTFKNYTTGVAKLRESLAHKTSYHENQIFKSRTEVEYYLNMVCAQIMNRAFRQEFINTTDKVVLLPTCMQSCNAACKAVPVNHYFKCKRCQKDCPVFKVSEKLTSVQVYLIPHSSGFSKTLKIWADQQEVGLVGVACVLNLLRGGYEMKNFNIPSQCVFLDYCGCEKHWKPYNRSTELNIEQLQKVLCN